jgi:Na+-transporting methylmalonyl-CoA/oxaloacetate decarboxylase gamma subunit
MLTSTIANANLGIGQAGILALLGYSVVFFGLILLMCVVIAMGKIFISKEKKATTAIKTAAPVAAPAAAPVVAEPVAAPGTAGQLKLHDVNPKTAAMIMAIVADKMGKPLNELRFISIKEVK